MRRIALSRRIFGLMIGPLIFGVVFLDLLSIGSAPGSIGGAAQAGSPERPPSYSETRLLRQDATLHSVAFEDGAHGVAVGDRGVIVTTEDGGQTWTHRESGVECRLDKVVWISANRVVAVGGAVDAITRLSRGVVVFSNDGGIQWQRGSDTDLPRLRTIDIQDDRTLLADGDWSHTALTRQFTSRDGGQTWDGVIEHPTPIVHAKPTGASELLAWARATGVAVAIRDACRADSSSLCAVGDHGLILTSSDNGKNWTTRLGGDRRTSVLMVARNAATIAWSIVGSESLESRNRVAVLIDSEIEPRRGSPVDATTSTHDVSFDAIQSLETTHQAAVTVGASGADRFRWGDDEDPLQTALQWIAVMRPVVVVLDQALAPETRDAFFQAATSAGVVRIAEYSTKPSQATTLHRDALLPKTGILASDLASDAMHLVAPNMTDIHSISVRYLYDAAPSRRTGDSVTSGLPLHPGHRITERSSPASRRQLQIVQARMKQSRQIVQLLDKSKASAPFATSLKSMLDQTAKEDQFRLAWSILAETSASDLDSIEFHETVLKEIATRFADRSAGSWAKLRAQSLRNSSELERLRAMQLAGRKPSFIASKGSTQAVAVSPFQIAEYSSVPTGDPVGDPSPIGQVRQVSAVAPLLVPKPDTVDYSRRETTQSIAEVDMAWEFHPAVLLGLEAARRRGDDAQLQVESDQPANLRRLIESHDNPWAPLLRRNGPQVIRASHTETPPHLDGRLDDECWQNSRPSMHAATSIRMAYDGDYVYVAVVCPSSLIGPDADSAADTNKVEGIVRDHNLSQVDHIRLNIDIDKDLITSMQLQASDDRRTHDAIDGNSDWQPTWYLDVDRTSDQLTFEIAVLRRDIVELPIETDSQWGETSWFVSARPIAAGQETNSQVMPSPVDWVRVIFQ